MEGPPDNEVIARLIAGELLKLTDACADAPAEIVRICDQALAHKPSDRYATAAAMRRDILAYLDEARLNVTAETMSEYLSAVFAEKRADMKKIIEQQLSGMAKSPDLSAISASLPPPRRACPSSAPARPGARRSSRRRGRGRPCSRRCRTRRRPRRSSALCPRSQEAGSTSSRAGRSSSARSVVAVGTYAGLAHRSAAPVAAHVEAQALPPAGASAPEPAAAGIELRVHADPSSARLFLDDAALPANPFVGRFAADDLTHRLRIEATGYTTRTQLISFAKDAAVDVALAPTAAAAAAAPVAVRSPSRPPPAAADPPAATTSAPAAPTAPPPRARQSAPSKIRGPTAPSRPSRRSARSTQQIPSIERC